MDAATDAAPTRDAPWFDLVTGDGTARFTWRIANHGVAVERDALVLRRAGRWTRAPYDTIAHVTLSTAAIGRSGVIGQCTIQLLNGARIVVSSATSLGLPDATQNDIYRRFVAAFHERLAASPAAHAIAFTSGYSEARRSVLIIVGVVAAAFFIGLPLVLLSITGDIRVLLMLLFGAGLVWPLYRVVAANKPAAYVPQNPPDLLA